MASTSFLSCNFTTLHHTKPSKTFQAHAFDPLCQIALLSKHQNRSSFAGNGVLQSLRINQRPPTTDQQRLKRDLAVYATPEAVASFLPFLPADTPWFAWVGCLLVALPFAIQRLINLTNQVEAVAETVESIADTVGKVADGIDKAADEMMEKLPDGTLKNIVDKVEDIAEATSKEAQKVEDLMDKVEEVSNKVEDFLVETTSKQPPKATTDQK